MIGVVSFCPFCGDEHALPDARSLDPEEMGCNVEKVWLLRAEEQCAEIDAAEEEFFAELRRREIM